MSVTVLLVAKREKPFKEGREQVESGLVGASVGVS